MSVSGILIRAAALVCLFQLPLLEMSSLFSYFDEILALVMGACFVARTLKQRKISKSDMVLLFALAALVVLGLFYNLISGVPRTSVAIVQDVLTLLKVFACYLGAKYLFEGRMDCEALISWAARVVRTTVLTAFVCLILSYAGVLPFLSSGARFGLRSYEFIYGSPGMLSQYCVLYMVVLLADLSLAGSRKQKWMILALLFVVWAASLRARAFVMIFIVLLLYFVVFNPSLQIRTNGHTLLRRVLSPVFLVPSIFAVLVLAGDQIDLYFGELSSARSYLLHGGIRIFQDFFPFGTGFATYGTEAAGSYYSPLYAEYGLNAHWGLVPGGSELTDTFWPAVMAEFGLFGIVLYLIPLTTMLAYIVHSCSKDRDLLVTAVSFVAYTLIASTATGVFFSYTISDCMLFIGMAMGIAYQRSQSKSLER